MLPISYPPSHLPKAQAQKPMFIYPSLHVSENILYTRNQKFSSKKNQVTNTGHRGVVYLLIPIYASPMTHLMFQLTLRW